MIYLKKIFSPEIQLYIESYILPKTKQYNECECNNFVYKNKQSLDQHYYTIEHQLYLKINHYKFNNNQLK